MDIEETEWYQTRPPLIQQRIDEYPPLYLYRRKSNGYIVALHAYDEGEDRLCTICTVLVLQMYNPHKNIVTERRVFEIPFDDLERMDVLRNVDAE
jgi:hypothetical protein